MTRVEVRPHGVDVQIRYQRLVAGGLPPSRASELASSVLVDWPDGVRLPVEGEYLQAEWAEGRVAYVSFYLVDDALDVKIKLRQRAFS